MLTSPNDLFAYLDDLNIVHETVWHEAIFTVDEGRHLKTGIPGGHTKNLFMKDKSGTIILIAAHADSQLKLNQLHKLLGTRRLSFASAETMAELLGVVPGSVTGFALANDVGGKVRFVLDAALDCLERINFHPLTNIGTTGVSLDDFRTFVAATGHDMTVVDFTQL